MSTMRRLARFTPIALILVAIFVLGIIVAQWVRLPLLTEEQVRETILTTIQRESAASFLVTGTLDMTASVTVESQKLFLPGVLDFDMGTTRATVRAPGRATYGFDLRRIRPEHIQLEGDSVVVVTIPPLSVLGVEPDLSRLDVQTRVGWARLESSSGRRTEREALSQINNALRVQAEQHLRGESMQPRVNTARAMEAMLRPAFAALERDDLRLRFQLSPEIVLEGDGR